MIKLDPIAKITSAERAYKSIVSLTERWRLSLTRRHELLSWLQVCQNDSYAAGVEASIVCLENNGQQDAATLLIEAYQCSTLRPEERAALRPGGAS